MSLKTAVFRDQSIAFTRVERCLMEEKDQKAAVRGKLETKYQQALVRLLRTGKLDQDNGIHIQPPRAMRPSQEV